MVAGREGVPMPAAPPRNQSPLSLRFVRSIPTLYLVSFHTNFFQLVFDVEGVLCNFPCGTVYVSK